MKPGFRKQKVRSSKEQVQELSSTVSGLVKVVENMQQAIRIQQMVVQQFAKNSGKMDKDIHNAMGVLNDLQYRTLALVETNSVSKDELDKVADSLKLKDFEDASDREDKEKNYTIVDEIAADSVVIVSTECEEDPNTSIFRSKFKLDESANKELMGALPGNRVGSKLEITLNGKKHLLTVHGVRSVPQEKLEEQAAEAEEAAPVPEAQQKTTESSATAVH